MQIKKINNNKLKVILSSNDLNKKNVDIDSFLSNSIESQDLFFEILDLAEEKYDFNIENNKAIVETVSLDNNLFVLTITKLKNDLTTTYSNLSKLYYFENIDDFFNIYNYLNNYNFSLYKFLSNYFLVIHNIDNFLNNLLSEYSISLEKSEHLESILLEHGKIINLKESKL